MTIDLIPVWMFFFVVLGIIILSIEIGYRVGRSLSSGRHDEMESTVSSMAGVILGLQAFMLAFTFGIVSDRYEVKKGLVREEANVIRNAWRGAEFLPQADKTRTRDLLITYVDSRVAVVLTGDPLVQRGAHEDFLAIHQQLFDMAAANAQADKSDIAAMYVESINKIEDLHASRVAIGINARIPTAIWVTLLFLLMFGMAAMGYHCAIAESRRSRVAPVLALAFSVVIALIAALDNPGDSIMPVPQQPLIDLSAQMKLGSVSAPTAR